MTSIEERVNISCHWVFFLSIVFELLLRSIAAYPLMGRNTLPFLWRLIFTEVWVFAIKRLIKQRPEWYCCNCLRVWIIFFFPVIVFFFRWYYIKQQASYVETWKHRISMTSQLSFLMLTWDTSFLHFVFYVFIFFKHKNYFPTSWWFSLYLEPLLQSFVKGLEKSK